MVAGDGGPPGQGWWVLAGRFRYPVGRGSQLKTLTGSATPVGRLAVTLRDDDHRDYVTVLTRKNAERVSGRNHRQHQAYAVLAVLT
jgi:hypothetical protein